jgi:hypothetical protein
MSEPTHLPPPRARVERRNPIDTWTWVLCAALTVLIEAVVLYFWLATDVQDGGGMGLVALLGLVPLGGAAALDVAYRWDRRHGRL